MKKLLLLASFLTLINSNKLFSQILFSNGALISIQSNALVHSNGGVELDNSSTLTNNGSFTINKNSSFSNPGTFSILNGTVVNGNGLYSVEQNWINNATFTADNSTVRLLGNTEQFITSTNGTITEFNILMLSGNGTGIDRRKSLLNVDVRISTSGQLNINDRELFGNIQDVRILNSSNSAIVNSTTLNNEGFISNLIPGSILWNTNSSNNYIFPVGSSDGTLRYRPIMLKPQIAASSVYTVRMNNYSSNLDSYLQSSKEASLEILNNLYYHSIDRISGETVANISIAYDANNDGEFNGIGHWNVFNNLWEEINSTSESPFGNYQSLLKENWTFKDDGQPYILSNVEEFLEIPNVFTPNGDGTNDFYVINSKGIEELTIVIVNRWGETVFESSEIDGKWDGTSNGNLCTDGVYFYIVNAKSKTQNYQKQGHITLNAN